MPEWTVLCKHKRKPENKEFCDQYRDARKTGFESRMDDAWEMVQDRTNDIIYDEIERLDKDGNIKSIEKVAKSDNTGVNRSRLIAEQLRWEAARIYKDLYGDKIQSEITGKDGAELQAFSPILNITIKKDG